MRAETCPTSCARATKERTIAGSIAIGVCFREDKVLGYWLPNRGCWSIIIFNVDGYCYNNYNFGREEKKSIRQIDSQGVAYS